MTNAEVQALLDQAIAEMKQATAHVQQARDGLVIPVPPVPVFTITQSIPNGATLTAPLPWIATPSAEAVVSKVEFSIDGVVKWTESISPYVFNGDGNLLDPATLSAGSHTLNVTAYIADGTKGAQANSTVTVVLAPTTGTQGDVGFGVDMGGGWADGYVSAKNPGILTNWDRVLSYGNPMDPSWYHTAWFYIDSYANYRNPDGSARWPALPILKDSSGRKVYISFACANGSCSQYAADIGDPLWINDIIKRAKDAAAKGYLVMFDDVNLLARFSNGSQDLPFSAVIDPRTGVGLTSDNWNRYFCELIEKAKAAVPTIEVLTNQVWFAGPNHDGRDPWSQRMFKATDVVLYEFGFVDGGLTGGTGEWSTDRLMKNADAAHDAGAKVWMMSHAATSLAQAEYQLAGTLLISRGGDFVYARYGADPTTAFWPGWKVNLGAEKGPRAVNAGLWRRDFAHGVAFLNEPGAATKTIPVTGKRIDGSTVSSITLAARQGAVILT